MIHTTIYPNEALRSEGGVGPRIFEFNIVMITYPDDWRNKEVMSGRLMGVERSGIYLYAFSDTVPVQDQIQNVGHYQTEARGKRTEVKPRERWSFEPVRTTMYPKPS